MTNDVHGSETDRWGGWSWREPRYGEHFHTCSYCGSIHPDDLVAEPHCSIDWADQKYGWPHKFYVHVLNRDPDRTFVVGAASGGDPAHSPGSRYTRWEDLTESELKVCHDEGYPHRAGWHPEWIMFGTRDDHFAKFYTTHLKDPEISDDVKETIQRMCGLRITFADGRVSWVRYEERTS